MNNLGLKSTLFAVYLVSSSNHNSIRSPENVKLIAITEADAFKTTRKLISNHQIFAGLKSGAVYAAATSYATGKKAVCVFGDAAHTYHNTLLKYAWTSVLRL